MEETQALDVPEDLTLLADEDDETVQVMLLAGKGLILADIGSQFLQAPCPMLRVCCLLLSLGRTLLAHGQY